MISRYLLILLAFGVGIDRAAQGAWLAAAGLFALGVGLLVLKAAEKRPEIKPIAYLCFFATAASIGSTAIVGAAVGYGQSEMAIVLAAVTYVTLVALGRLESRQVLPTVQAPVESGPEEMLGKAPGA